MDRPRFRFALALTLFTGWVFALVALAFLSANRPEVRASIAVPR